MSAEYVSWGSWVECSEEKFFSKGDSGVDHIYLDKENRPYITKVPPKLELFMGGNVTRIPTVGCFPTCEAFDGEHFFIDGHGLNKVDGTFFVPGC